MKSLFFRFYSLSFYAVASAYTFIGNNEATYKINARSSFMVINNDASISTIYADSTSHSALISGGLGKRESVPLARRADFVGCTDEQQAAISTAVTAAQSYALNADEYVADSPSESNGERYLTWFGGNNALRHGDVAIHLNSISSNNFSQFSYDCQTCTLVDVFAYVYPDQ